jgi:ATP-dependent exoDNAse (exonuclease V) alpha subunit
MTKPELTPSQRVVADAMLEFCAGRTPHGVATLAGYAGVGKTTVVAEVVHALSGIGVKTVVLAPTHKALAVLADKIGSAGVETMTLQAALALKLKELPDGRQETEDTGEPGSMRDFDLAIIDEASMVSDGMFATALSKRGACRLLFVGDPAQLPPVDQPKGAGAQHDVLQLSPAFGENVSLQWRLTEVVRQAQDNPIIRLATAARLCIDNGREFTLQSMLKELRPGDDSYLAMQPGGVLEVARLVADAIQYGQDTRALALDNATVQAINANVHAMVYPRQGVYPAGAQLIAQDSFGGWEPDSVDTPVWKKVVVRNSALMRVKDCSESPHPSEPYRPAFRLTLECEDGAQVACWVAADQQQWQADISAHFAEYRRLKLRESMTAGGEARALREQASESTKAGWALKARYAPLRYAYAMTVHKSQGSTFDAVVLAWDSFQRSRDVQMRNRLAYVALTRTRRFAVVCA